MYLTRREAMLSAAAIALMPTIARADTVIGVKDSPLPQALEIYYDFIARIAGIDPTSPRDRFVMGNTITSFDIRETTPYFNENLFRSFADRNYDTSPDFIGPANTADRFSSLYQDVIVGAADQIDQRHPEIVPKLQELKEAIGRRTEALASTNKKIEDAWKKTADGSGLKPDDKNYDVKHIAFLENVHYASQIKQDSDDIAALILRRDQVRRSVYTAPERSLLNCAVHLEESYKLARPRRANLELTSAQKTINDYFLGDQSNWNSSLEIGPEVLPLGDLTLFLKSTGVRSLTISASNTTTTHHDSAWGGSAGGSFGFFGIGGSGGGSGSSSNSYTNTVKKSQKLQLDFMNIAEVLVDRGEWFNSALFDSPDLHKLFEKNPSLNRLKNVSVSLVIGRGLTLTLFTSDQIDANSWSSENIRGSGGVSFMGFSFGGSASSSNNSYTVSVTENGTALKFQDDASYCRVLGVRTSPINRATFVEPALTTATTPSTAARLDTKNLPGRNIDVRSLSYRDFNAGITSFSDLMKK